ncbi:MAG TPA: hypothetical protein VGI37_12575 [Streptosporangiaceae bacterium]
MRIPPPPERIKEAPAHALRAVFAGVGQVLLITERVRQRAVEQVHPQMTSAPAHAPAPDAPPPPPARSAAPPAAQAAASRVAAPAAAAPAAAAPAVAPAEAPAPEAAAPQGGAAALPVPNYDELSIASLRARLRALDAAQVRDLLDYERAHASRANVITMFERRIAKLEGTENADTTAG